MDCNHGQEFMNQYFDQQLNQTELTELKKHLETCEACKTDFELYKSIQTELMNTESVELPDDFHETLMNRIKETPIKSKINMVIKQLNIAAVFVFVLVFALIGINNLTQQKTSSDMAMTEATTSSETFEIMDVAEDSMMMVTPEMAVTSEAPEATMANESIEPKSSSSEEATTTNEEDSLTISSSDEERHQKAAADITPQVFGVESEEVEAVSTIESNLKWLYPIGGGILLIFLIMSYRLLKKE